MGKSENIVEEERPGLELFLHYAKIILLTFVIPLNIIIAVNWAAVLIKFLATYSPDFIVWDNPRLVAMTLFVLLFPVIYSAWFYYRLFQKIAIQYYHDYVDPFIKKNAPEWASDLIEGQDSAQVIFEMKEMLLQKCEQLHWILRWGVEKIFKQIPIVQFFDAIRTEDLQAGNEEKVGMMLHKNCREATLETINGIIPAKVWLIFPINVIVLVVYFLM